MTYQELKALLETLTLEQLQQDVTIELHEEFWRVTRHFATSDDENRLDSDHVVLVVEWD